MSTKKDNFNNKDNFFMEIALDLAKARQGLTGPNPSVGCIIVKNNRIISIGQTSFNGRPHAELNAIKNSIEDKKDGPLKEKTFLLTGKLDGISRAEAKSMIEQNSGTIVSSVSNKLNYLITGEKPTKRKVESAKELKIKVINQDEFLKMLNVTS